ncbi:MAG: hypothetical protein WDZ50_04975 [Woeseia sp.]
MRTRRSTERMIDIHAFEAGNIDPVDFDHAAHVHIAWLYLQQTSLAEAIVRFTAALRQLTVRAGADAKYHETITWFFLIVIAERRAATPGADWHTFRRDNADLLGDASILRRFYSTERLRSKLAKQQFLLPDRQSLHIF